jgi:hypothetical protein
MKKYFIGVLALAVLSGLGSAQESPSWMILADGTSMEIIFVSQIGNTITVKQEGQTVTYNTWEVGALIFDNGYTDFYSDDANKARANPHLAVQKSGDVLAGSVTSFLPGGQMVIVIQSRPYTYEANTVARIYYNVHAFFAAVEITGKNSLVAEDEDEGEEEEKPDRDRKDKDKKKEEEVQYQTLVGGEVLIVLRGGASTLGIISDVRGTQATIWLRDGRQIPLANIKFINYQSTQTDYPGDKGKVQVGWVTFIMRNGAVTHGLIKDYRGTDPFWELQDGRQIPASQVGRIYFP